MIKVQFYTPLSVDPPTFERVEMPVVPRIGDYIMFEEDGEEYIVRTVTWTPSEPDYDAYVCIR